MLRFVGILSQVIYISPDTDSKTITDKARKYYQDNSQMIWDCFLERLVVACLDEFRVPDSKLALNHVCFNIHLSLSLSLSLSLLFFSHVLIQTTFPPKDRPGYI